MPLRLVHHRTLCPAGSRLYWQTVPQRPLRDGLPVSFDKICTVTTVKTYFSCRSSKQKGKRLKKWRTNSQDQKQNKKMVCNFDRWIKRTWNRKKILAEQALQRLEFLKARKQNRTPQWVEDDELPSYDGRILKCYRKTGKPYCYVCAA